MKTFKVTIKYQTLAGEQTRTHEVKAKTLASAQKKAWAIIGNQSGEVIAIVG